jgi:hypothetical protein
MKNTIAPLALLALMATFPLLSSAQSAPSASEDSTPQIPLRNVDAYAFRLEEAEQQAKNTMNHDLSGMVCPYIIANHGLTSLTQFSYSGHDVSCGYTSETSDSYITAYMSRYGEEMTPEIILQNATSQIEQVHTVLRAQDTRKTNLVFGNVTLPCLQKQYRLIVNGVEKNSGTWACSLDGWAIKFRATWDSDDATPLSGITDFSARQNRAAANLSTCAAQRAIREDAPSRESDIASVLFFATEFQTLTPLTAPMCFIEQYAADSRGLLLASINSDRGDTLISQQFDGTGQIDGTRIEARRASEAIELAVVELGASKGPVWQLMSFPNDSTMKLFKEYEGLPSSAQFANDALAFANGKLQSIGGISRDEDGNTSVEVSDMMLGDDETED